MKNRIVQAEEERCDVKEIKRGKKCKEIKCQMPRDGKNYALKVAVLFDV